LLSIGTTSFDQFGFTNVYIVQGLLAEYADNDRNLTGFKLAAYFLDGITIVVSSSDYSAGPSKLNRVR
jgi:hypothetical protein